MKHLALFTTTLLISLCAFSQADYSNWQTAESKAYSLKYPSGWNADIMGDAGITMMASDVKKDADDKFKENFGVLVKDHSKKPISLSEFAEEQVKEIKNGMANTTFLGSQRLERGDGDMYRITYVRNQNGLELLYDSRVVLKDNTSIMIVFTMERSKFSEYESILNQIIESLVVK